LSPVVISMVLFGPGVISVTPTNKTRAQKRSMANVTFARPGAVSARTFYRLTRKQAND
jgi:hypothetical protein